MIEKLQASWRSYREKRRQYQIERALYKARGGGDARHGGFGGEIEKSPEAVMRRNPGGGGDGP